MSRKRRYFSPEDKIKLLRLNILDGLSVSQVCEAHGLHITAYYRWREMLLGPQAAANWPGRNRRRENTIGHLRTSDELLDRNTDSQRGAQEWMHSVLQASVRPRALRCDIRDRLTHEEVCQLLTCVCQQPLKYRNRAIAVLAYCRGIRRSHIAKFLRVGRSTVYRWIERFETVEIGKLINPFRNEYQKTQDERFRIAIFEILHSPPALHGINRTNWRQKDLHMVMARRGMPIAMGYIAKIIKDAGYGYRKAKKILTSSDPDYRRKLKKITRVLSNLRPNEKFFSVDEYGPFAVQKRGGRSLVPRGHANVVPQRQKSKGCLIITGALELSTNQVTHFYSVRKNTEEMIKLLDILIKTYAKQQCIYFSWDAASWHASKELYLKVAAINSSKIGGTPQVKLVPLPSCAQFLNVIESVFSGMARAVLHNSDYSSVADCKKAIDRHFWERNQHFMSNPKRAGDKIWGKERVEPVFRESNNCKDPRYR